MWSRYERVEICVCFKHPTSTGVWNHFEPSGPFQMQCFFGIPFTPFTADFEQPPAPESRVCVSVALLSSRGGKDKWSLCPFCCCHLLHECKLGRSTLSTKLSVAPTSPKVGQRAERPGATDVGSQFRKCADIKDNSAFLIVTPQLLIFRVQPHQQLRCWKNVVLYILH